jgi:hypothetical protein
MKNRGEEKSDGSREAAATKCFLSVLFFSCRLIVNVVRRRKKKKNEDDDDDDDGGSSSSSGRL